MPTVEFHAETLAALQERYSRALEYVYDSQKIATAGAIRPGEVPCQIFDFTDGLRLIISRQRVDELDEDFNYTGGKVVILHVSASNNAVSELQEKLKRMCGIMHGMKVLEWWFEVVEGRFAELSGNHKPLEFLGFDGQVGHWMQEE